MSNGYALSPSQRLIQRAREHAHIYRNFDLCIVVVGTGFEVGVRELLRSACEARGIRTLSRKQGKGKKAPTIQVQYLDAIERGDLKTDLLDYVNQVGGTNGRGGRKYNDWEQYSYKLRNAIVHQGKQGYGNSDADTAFTSAVTYLEFLRSQLLNSSQSSSPARQ